MLKRPMSWREKFFIMIVYSCSHSRRVAEGRDRTLVVLCRVWTCEVEPPRMPFLSFEIHDLLLGWVGCRVHQTGGKDRVHDPPVILPVASLSPLGAHTKWASILGSWARLMSEGVRGGVFSFLLSSLRTVTASITMAEKGPQLSEPGTGVLGVHISWQICGEGSYPAVRTCQAGVRWGSPSPH